MDRCVCCGTIVPEGRLVCWACEKYGPETAEGGKKTVPHISFRIMSSGMAYVTMRLGLAPQYVYESYLYNPVDDSFSSATFRQSLIASSTYSSNGKASLAQVEMRADPTTNMQIATKQYVDNLALPVVTTADNGKILKVVDGVWTVADA